MRQASGNADATTTVYCQNVQVQSRVQRRSAALDKRDGTWERCGDTFHHGLFRIEFADFAGRYFVYFAEQSVIGGEPKPEGKREREYPLTIRSQWQYVIDEVFHGLGHPLTEATWTKASAFAAVSDRRLKLAPGTKNPDKAVLQDAALQIAVQLLGDADRHWPIFGCAVSDKGLDIRRQRFVEDRFFGLPAPVGVLACCGALVHAVNIAELAQALRTTSDVRGILTTSELYKLARRVLNMAAGDATRVWFKEVDVILISRWKGAMSGAELAALASALSADMTSFRERRGILPPILHCPRCQTSAHAKSPVIHGGSVIFAAKRLGLIGDAEVGSLQTMWRRYLAQQRRVGRGRVINGAPGGGPCRRH